MGEAIELSAPYARARSRGAELGMSTEEYISYRRELRADYKRTFPPKPVLGACVSILCTGALFFLLDPDAVVGCTIANREMTADEHEQYRMSPASRRRRKPGETVDDDEERARKRRVVELEKQIAGDTRGTVVLP